MAGAGQRRAWRLAPLLLGGCLATAGGTGWGADVVRTDPQHLHPVPEDVIPGYVPEPPVLWTKKPLVVMRASTEWR